MELEGFNRKITSGNQDEWSAEYTLKDRKTPLRLQVTRRGDNHLVLKIIEHGGIPGATDGEILSSPLNTDELFERLLKAMAVYHFSAIWLEDGYTAVDVEMIDRGFHIAKYSNGKPVWFRNHLGITQVIARENSDALVASFGDPVRMTIKPYLGAETTIKTETFKTLLGIMDENAHFNMTAQFTEAAYVVEDSTRH